ncbi:hypothetical protein NDU88_003509 [Pleurodeles waltl]|uniref:Uncharacterized protein n=1 Tax=Pleurodeles waltl TaxID=8319 RepID=A0AAV7MB99_PLEWA|nr:hypothetical protein NDU88_003509 [Pleurodeles waltl]
MQKSRSETSDQLSGVRTHGHEKRSASSETSKRSFVGLLPLHTGRQQINNKFSGAEAPEHFEEKTNRYC